MQANQIEAPRKTFWFERHNGTVFCVHEEEAWRIISNRNQAYLRHQAPKLIGVSDGTLFWKAVMDAHDLVKTDPEKAKERIRQGQQEELESGRGKIIMPRNFDVIDKYGNPTTL